MKKYEKPMIEEEKIILEDIIAVSNKGQADDSNTDSSSLFDLQFKMMLKFAWSQSKFSIPSHSDMFSLCFHSA